MQVKDILEVKGHEVYTLAPSAQLLELSQMLVERRIGAVVIVDGVRPVGIVSERDIVDLVSKGGSLNSPASTVMTTDLVTCDPETETRSLATRMTERRFRHCPVVDGGELIGIVSIGDVVKARLDDLEAEREHLADYLNS